MDSIVEALARNATEYPEKTALGFEGQNFSYTRLYRDVTRFAAGLKKWGLAPGDKVALFLENCPEFVMAYLGTHLAGGTVVLVNTQYRQVELRHILTDSEARLVVTGPGGCTELDHLKADLPGLEAMVVVGSTNQASGIPALDFEAFLAEPTAAFDFPTAKSLAIIAYTSGTTGQAKGAMLLHSNLASNIATLTTTWEWTAADRLLLVLPLFHAHGLMVGLHGTIWTGASAELRRKFEAASVLETLQQDTNLTMFFGVPTMYGRLLEGAAKLNGLPRPLRLYVSGSAPLSRETFNAFEKIFGQRILERYGMTETIMNMTNPYHGAEA